MKKNSKRNFGRKKRQDVGGTARTDEGVEALWLVVPVDAQEVDGHAGEHDGQANATHHGLRPEGEDEQEGPEQQVDDGPHQADLLGVEETYGNGEYGECGEQHQYK